MKLALIITFAVLTLCSTTNAEVGLLKIPGNDKPLPPFWTTYIEDKRVQMQHEIDEQVRRIREALENQASTELEIERGDIVYLLEHGAQNQQIEQRLRVPYDRRDKHQKWG
jgi:hypothetical protein